jgi:hypothetical protein
VTKARIAILRLEIESHHDHGTQNHADGDMGRPEGENWLIHERELGETVDAMKIAGRGVRA